ncbi:MAG: hypothetical protein ASARMPRED_009134 [Alectoria sarmentosa]|nr:MAG: hypothetical protein ASARMPRED_009134 [Alectoria sarmentosa]
MQAFKKSRWIIVALHLLLTTAATAPSSSFSKNHNSLKSSTNHQLSPEPPPQTPIPPAPPPPLQNKRSPPNGGPIQTTTAHGWAIKYRQYESIIIPIQVAASVLETFYADCLRRIALKQTRNRPSPGNAFTFQLGSVYLAFRAADRTQGLDWWACEIVVDALLANARNGFARRNSSRKLVPPGDGEAGLCQSVHVAAVWAGTG